MALQKAGYSIQQAEEGTIMRHLRAAFSPQFVIQMVFYGIMLGIAWGSQAGQVKTVDSKVATVHEGMAEIRDVNIPAMNREIFENKRHRLNDDVHMPLEKKLEIFVSKELYKQSQSDLKKDVQALTQAVHDLQKDVKELLKSRSGS